MPDAVHTSFKDLVSVVRRSPAMLITLVIIVLVIAYIVYKRSQSGTANAAAGTSTTDGATSPGYFLVYNEATTPPVNVTVNDADSATHPAPMPAPTPAPKTGIARCSSSTQNGQVCLGPTGIHHYKTTGNETLRQIASRLGGGPSNWNEIYAIPDNQKLFGKLSPGQAATYKPKSGEFITVPPWGF